jgi:signal transduction histidine kinase
MSSVSALSRAAAASGSPVGRELERIRRAVSTLERMTSDLLDVSAPLEASRRMLQRVPVCIGALVTDAVACVPELAERWPVRVEGDADVLVHADPGRIVQVLAHLLANAVKYGESDAPIEVDIKRMPREARVTVANRGPGIPSSDLPRVFERFYRAEGVRTSRPGLGLGLAIVKTIVDAHGGRVHADSVPRAVTRFTFTLPLAGSDDTAVGRRASE